MIITKLQGGLGNQMFQYAIGRHLAHLNNTELKLDISVYDSQNKNDTPRRYSLESFNIVGEIAKQQDTKKMKLPHMVSKNIFARAYRKLFRYLEIKKSINKRTYINEPYFKFCEDVLKRKGDAYLSGNWQSEDYFKDIDSIIRKDFTLKDKSAIYKNKLQQILSIDNSVSLHVRRGDYVNNPKTKENHGVLPISYYNKAVQLIEEKTENPTFFIFSDDIKWVKENLKTDSPTIFISDERLKDFEELILMSNCAHNIIANSSFSWWGAWLNNNPLKIVIAPKMWFRNPSRIKDNPSPESWIRI